MYFLCFSEQKSNENQMSSSILLSLFLLFFRIKTIFTNHNRTCFIYIFFVFDLIRVRFIELDLALKLKKKITVYIQDNRLICLNTRGMEIIKGNVYSFVFITLNIRASLITSTLIPYC